MLNHEPGTASPSITPGLPILEVEIRTPHGLLKERVAAPAQMRLGELAAHALPLDDRLVESRVAAETRDGRTISCRKGCFSCCYHLIPVSAPEAWMLADLVASFPEPRREAVMRRFDQARRKMMEAGLLGGRSGSPGEQPSEKEKALEYFRLGIPCPFLDEGACSIYSKRPAVCREYLVTSPAALCSDPERNKGVTVRLHRSLTNALARVFAQVTGKSPWVMPLILALEWAGSCRGSSRRNYDSAAMVAMLAENLSTSRPVPDPAR